VVGVAGFEPATTRTPSVVSAKFDITRCYSMNQTPRNFSAFSAVKVHGTIPNNTKFKTKVATVRELNWRSFPRENFRL